MNGRIVPMNYKQFIDFFNYQSIFDARLVGTANFIITLKGAIEGLQLMGMVFPKFMADNLKNSGGGPPLFSYKSVFDQFDFIIKNY